MKLFRFGPSGYEKPGVEYPDGRRLDVSEFGSDYNESFFETDGINRLKNWLATYAAQCLPVDKSVRIGPCVARPSKIVGIGLNYRDHAQEASMAIPKEPVIFLKATSSLSGPFDPIPMPPSSQKLDWEVEIAIVIGKKAALLSEQEAVNYIAGYALVNDVSERSYQLEGTGQWTKGKSFDGFGPLGPYFIPASQLPDPQHIALQLSVNEKVMQSSNTANMIFGINYLVSYISQYMTLLPGDVIITGTPAGVGLGHKPAVFLQVGDEVVLKGEGLGTQRQKVVPFKKDR
ncbi:MULTISPECIES: fumarylacetoacetate hydrolase family protein [Dyadobacter]|uniref:fumarylacetoacetate hydrolase family protein n=1 Tax=Dyadobacter TaxID=120831 RepID=UPI00286C649C|nr:MULTISPECIES: fumarylacetoacetate hydrolase family protein [Dyadobacter]